jgi:HEAT repeat protein
MDDKRRIDGGRTLTLVLLALLALLSGSCAPRTDVEKLFVQMNSDDYEERVEARQRLGELVEKGEVEPFARGLRSRHAETRVQCILHLLAIRSPEAKTPLVGELELSRRFNVFYNPIRLVPVSTPSDSRIMIANILWTKGGDPRAAETLAKDYGHEPDVPTRVSTVYALGALHDSTAVPALKNALKDEDMRVTQAAVEGLKMMEAPGIVESLVQNLTDSREKVRSNSASALGGFHDPAVSDALIKTVRQDASERVRLAALQALPNAGGFPTFGVILGLLKDPRSDEALKDQAAKALSSLTGQDLGQDTVRWSKWWDQHKASLGQ